MYRGAKVGSADRRQVEDARGWGEFRQVLKEKILEKEDYDHCVRAHRFEEVGPLCIVVSLDVTFMIEIRSSIPIAFS
ncbi:hypothetical protein RB195_000998 [Necator americanus]|uniref:Uncharacterized protein n=1 Tax=Necator americanus TaxID=51031 RepID=A0ABR1DDW8_NECAM